MQPDDNVCLCFRVSLRKLVNYMEREQPTVASQLSECLGAGTGCQWCVPYLRGLHAQWRKPQGKLVRVLQGEVFDVAVDARRSSPTFGKWVGVTLSAENRHQIWVPPGFVHGFCVTSETAEVEYKCTDVYDPGGELTVIWNDPAIGVKWPVDQPLLSAKDLAGKPLAAWAAQLPA